MSLSFGKEILIVEMVLVFILVVVIAKLFYANMKLHEKILCTGIILLCFLTYLVSLIPFVFWPMIIWLRSQ